MIKLYGLVQSSPSVSTQTRQARIQEALTRYAYQLEALETCRIHQVIDDEHFGIDHTRGGWALDAFIELDFANQQAADHAINSEVFKQLHDTLSPVIWLSCEPHEVVKQTPSIAPALKRMTLLTRISSLSESDFRREWLETHASWVSQWPNVLGYTQNLVTTAHNTEESNIYTLDTPTTHRLPSNVDGIVEFWFKDKATAAQIYASDIVTQTQQHALTFLDEITPFFVETIEVDCP